VRLTDTHCHLYFQNYRDDLQEVLDRARSAGVVRILVPAIDLESCKKTIKLAESDPILFGAVGVHPNSGLSWSDSTLDELRAYIGHPRIVAVGEIGLDYYRDRTPHKLQKQILEQQLILASKNDLPVVLHVRNRSEDDRRCMADLLTILDNWLRGEEGQADRAPGVIHSFSGNTQEAERAQEMGFLIGITGPVTYKNAHGMREVVREMDIKKLLIETDGPFLSPQERRGKRNEPAHVSYIIDKISEIRGMPAEELAAQTAENAADVFKWE
jgi:TatD DNase family protein